MGPLSGVRVVVTRPRAQAGRLVAALERHGAEVLLFPAIRIVGPADPARLRQAVSGLGRYDWVVFNSTNGVDLFFEALSEAGRDASALSGVRVACVGPVTARALERRGVRADVVPDRYVAEEVVSALVASHGPALAGARVLLPVAAAARPVLADGLAAAGADVDQVEAYRAVADTAGLAGLRRRLEAGEVDVITVASGLTAEYLVDAIGPDLGRAVVAVIGPVTAAAARRLGLPVAIEAKEYTAEGLVAAVVEHFAAERRGSGRV